MCFVPRCVSLDVTLRSKEGRKGENGRFSSFSFLWFLTLCHQKLKFRALLCLRPRCKKTTRQRSKELLSHKLKETHNNHILTDAMTAQIAN